MSGFVKTTKESDPTKDPITNYINHINCMQKSYKEKLKTLTGYQTLGEKYRFIKKESTMLWQNKHTSFVDGHDILDEFMGMGPVPLMMMGLSFLKLLKSAYKGLESAICGGDAANKDALCALNDSAAYALVAIASFLKSIVHLFTKTIATIQHGWASATEPRFDANYPAEKTASLDDLIKNIKTMI